MPLTLPFSYKFRQASDFWYLTGFQEPDAAVVIGTDLPGICVDRVLIFYVEKAPSTPKGYRMTMFCEEADAHSTLWEGARTGTDGAVRKFGADDVSILLTPYILSDPRSRPIQSPSYEADSGPSLPPIPTSTSIWRSQPHEEGKPYSIPSATGARRKESSNCSSIFSSLAGEGCLRQKSQSSEESRAQQRLR